MNKEHQLAAAKQKINKCSLKYNRKETHSTFFHMETNLGTLKAVVANSALKASRMTFGLGSVMNKEVMWHIQSAELDGRSIDCNPTWGQTNLDNKWYTFLKKNCNTR